MMCRSALGVFRRAALRADFLAHDEGLAMLVLEGPGCGADAKAFRAAASAIRRVRLRASGHTAGTGQL